MKKDGNANELEIDISNQEALQSLYTKCYPGGSGPLGMMRIIVSLIEAIAEEKGYDLEAPF